MKDTFIKIGFGLILGIFIALLFRCEKKCPEIKTITEYKENKVEVPVEKIVYKPGSVKTVYIPVEKRDTVVIYETIPTNVSVVPTRKYIIPFKYEKDSAKISGVANIVSDSLHKFSFDILNFSYTEKTVIKTIEAKRRINLLLGTNLIFTNQSDFMQGVNFNVAFKTRKDFVFEAGYNAMFDLPDNYSAGVKIPIFNRKK